MLKDLIIAFPLGIIYNIFMHKLANLSLSFLPYEERYQKVILLLFALGIIGIIVAQTIFTKYRAVKSRPVRYGLLFGSFLLMFYSVITSWDKLEDNTKLILMGIILSCIIWYCYSDKKDKINKKTEDKVVETQTGKKVNLADIEELKYDEV